MAFWSGLNLKRLNRKVIFTVSIDYMEKIKYAVHIKLPRVDPNDHLPTRTSTEKSRT